MSDNMDELWEPEIDEIIVPNTVAIDMDTWNRFVAANRKMAKAVQMFSEGAVGFKRALSRLEDIVEEIAEGEKP